MELLTVYKGLAFNAVEDEIRSFRRTKPFAAVDFPDSKEL